MKTRRWNAIGFKRLAPGYLSMNISLTKNIVISGNGIIDVSKSSGFHGLNLNTLDIEAQPTPMYNGPTGVKFKDTVGVVLLAVEPATRLIRYTPQTLDQIASLIGGFASLVMTVLGIAIAGYHQFYKELNMISNIYTHEGQDCQSNDDLGYQDAIQKALRVRSEYHYNWFVYTFSSCVCRCCESRCKCL